MTKDFVNVEFENEVFDIASKYLVRKRKWGAMEPCPWKNRYSEEYAKSIKFSKYRLHHRNFNNNLGKNV